MSMYVLHDRREDATCCVYGRRMYGVSMYVLHDRREDATCCVYGTILFVGTHEEVRRRTWMKLRSLIQVRGSSSLVNEPRMEFFTYFL